MNKISQEFLKEYISSHTFGPHSDYDFVSLFKMFSAFDITSFSDLLSSPNRYAEFLTQNIYLIHPSSEFSKERIPALIEQARTSLNSKIRSAMSKPQKDFANMVTELSGLKKDSHLLDVGPGQIPYSSFLLSEYYDTVSAMDKDFYLPTDTMKNLNINPIEEYFTADTSVASFDIVVGKAPCSAIEHIVRNCAMQGKPYFIELCDCALPSKKPYVVDWYGWQDILPEIDKYVKFYSASSTYAFNLGDVSVEQAKKVISKYDMPRIFKDAPAKFEVTQKYVPDSNLWLQSDEIYEATEEITTSESSSKDDLEFLKMELFERN